MSEYLSAHLKNACSIIQRYTYKEPFPKFIKEYFRKNKKFGSRDRKIISEFCYCYFRVGESCEGSDIAFQIAVGFYLSHVEDNGIVALQLPSALMHMKSSRDEKIKVLERSFTGFSSDRIFPMLEQVSRSLNHSTFLLSHFSRSPVFLRIRPGFHEVVETTLQDNSIFYERIGENCLRLDKSVELSGILQVDKQIVVQDLSSQRISEFFPDFTSSPIRVWDACAGSGGKSLLAIDHYSPGNVRLIVSDIREYILEELKSRIKRGGNRLEDGFVIDLSNALAVQVMKSNYSGNIDLVMLDVPCSGSGTWGRNPEWLRSFDKEQIFVYSKMQQSIIRNAVPSLSSGGFLLYITCSVYQSENEDQVRFVTEELGLKVIKSGYMTSFEQGGDCLFAALFSK